MGLTLDPKSPCNFREADHLPVLRIPGLTFSEQPEKSGLVGLSLSCVTGLSTIRWLGEKGSKRENIMLINLKAYHRPESIDEAVTLLREGAPSTVALAGGTTLVASGRRDVEAVVDLRNLSLSYVHAQSATLCIGATTTLQQLIDHPDLGTFASGVLPETARAVAGRNQRNGATIGGAVASAGGEDPLLTALLALDARLKVFAPESRQIPIAGFLAYRQRLLEDGALIAEVRFPLLIGPLGAAYAAVGRTPRDRPIVCAVARLELAGGIAGNVRLALSGVAGVPVRATASEQMLERKLVTDDRVAAAAEKAAAGLTPGGDFRGSAEYRLAMTRVLARRALEEAVARAQITSASANAAEGENDGNLADD
jgi:carbon-monoxide dehydrogenase medium subunit